MAPNPRVAKAIRAMRDIGIPAEKTKHVLKKLIKVYDKNWELIEQENYRALADAIFDSDESEVAEQMKKLDDAEAAEKIKVEQAERMKAIEEETQIQDEPEKPLKRVRLRHQDGQASPSSINPNTNSSGNLLKMPKSEVNELPESQPKLQSPAEITVNRPILRADPRSVSPLKRNMNNGGQADLPIVLIKPKEEPLTDDPLRVEVPLALIMPESFTHGDTSTENNVVEEPDPTKTMNLSNLIQETSNETNGSTAELEIASSSSDHGSDYSGEPPVNTDAIPPFDTLKTGNDFEKETENRFENTHSVLVNTDAIPPTDSLKTGNDFEKETENGFEENTHFILVNTDAIPLTDSMKSGNDLEKETENGFEENTHFIPVNTDAITPVNKDVIPPTDSLKTGNDFQKEIENGFEENTHFIPVNTDVIPPTDSLKTGNDFEKETESGFEENTHFIPVNTDAIPPTDSLETGNDFEKVTESRFEENTHFVPDEIIDIAKGQENVVISLVNEVNTECPPSFHYIPRSAVFQNAYVNFSLARITDENCCSTCFGNCLTSSTPCQCALQTGSEFAYTNEGTIKEDLLDDCIQTNRDPQKCHLSYCKECPLEKPKNEGVLGTCKGHLDRSFIKECWLKCGCNKKCGNRVVQCGIRYKLQVFMTPDGRGWGLRALEELPKGAFVCEFVGEVLTCKELYNRVSQSSKKDEYVYPVFLDAEWGEEGEMEEDEALCLDATHYGNVSKFINHRCFDANLVEIPVEVENPDRHYYHLAFFTTRKVKALEELTRDYGIDFDDTVKAFECKCGSPFCRNIKGSSGSSRKRKCAQN